MLCIKPYVVNGVEFGCYVCKACRVNRRRLWTARMLLEAELHVENCMVTLTYEEAPAELVPEHMVKFLKRLRYYRDQPFRYYGCGEYGGIGGRPHYHIGLFGVSMAEEALLLKAWQSGAREYDCEWKPGFIHVAEINKDTVQYLTKYVCKSVKQLEEEEGKYPEFVRMSRNPGIGLSAIDGIVENLVRAHGGSIEPGDIGDVPISLRSGKRRFPLGTVLRRKMRVKLGWEANAPASVVKALSDETKARTAEETALRERRRVASYENLSRRERIFLKGRWRDKK